MRVVREWSSSPERSLRGCGFLGGDRARSALHRSRRRYDLRRTPETLEDLKAVPKRLSAPQLLNMVLGGETPLGSADAGAMGFALVLYANAALQGAILGTQTAFKALKHNGVLDDSAVASFAERQRLVD